MDPKKSNPKKKSEAKKPASDLTPEQMAQKLAKSAKALQNVPEGVRQITFDEFVFVLGSIPLGNVEDIKVLFKKLKKSEHQRVLQLSQFLGVVGDLRCMHMYAKAFRILLEKKALSFDAIGTEVETLRIEAKEKARAQWFASQTPYKTIKVQKHKSVWDLEEEEKEEEEETVDDEVLNIFEEMDGSSSETEKEEDEEEEEEDKRDRDVFLSESEEEKEEEKGEFVDEFEKQYEKDINETINKRKLEEKSIQTKKKKKILEERSVVKSHEDKLKMDNDYVLFSEDFLGPDMIPMELLLWETRIKGRKENVSEEEIKRRRDLKKQQQLQDVPLSLLQTQSKKVQDELQHMYTEIFETQSIHAYDLRINKISEILEQDRLTSDPQFVELRLKKPEWIFTILQDMVQERARKKMLSAMFSMEKERERENEKIRDLIKNFAKKVNFSENATYEEKSELVFHLLQKPQHQNLRHIPIDFLMYRILNEKQGICPSETRRKIKSQAIALMGVINESSSLFTLKPSTTYSASVLKVAPWVTLQKFGNVYIPKMYGHFVKCIWIHCNNFLDKLALYTHKWMRIGEKFWSVPDPAFFIKFTEKLKQNHNNEWFVDVNVKIDMPVKVIEKLLADHGIEYMLTRANAFRGSCSTFTSFRVQIMYEMDDGTFVVHDKQMNRQKNWYLQHNTDRVLLTIPVKNVNAFFREKLISLMDDYLQNRELSIRLLDSILKIRQLDTIEYVLTDMSRVVSFLKTFWNQPQVETNFAVRLRNDEFSAEQILQMNEDEKLEIGEIKDFEAKECVVMKKNLQEKKSMKKAVEKELLYVQLLVEFDKKNKFEESLPNFQDEKLKFNQRIELQQRKEELNAEFESASTEARKGQIFDEIKKLNQEILQIQIDPEAEKILRRLQTSDMGITLLEKQKSQLEAEIYEMQTFLENQCEILKKKQIAMYVMHFQVNELVQAYELLNVLYSRLFPNEKHISKPSTITIPAANRMLRETFGKTISISQWRSNLDIDELNTIFYSIPSVVVKAEVTAPLPKKIVPVLDLDWYIRSAIDEELQRH